VARQTALPDHQDYHGRTSNSQVGKRARVLAWRQLTCSGKCTRKDLEDFLPASSHSDKLKKDEIAREKPEREKKPVPMRRDGTEPKDFRIYVPDEIIHSLPWTCSLIIPLWH
jgi:hypothetical protein